jgi:hypothetical protein
MIIPLLAYSTDDGMEDSTGDSGAAEAKVVDREEKQGEEEYETSVPSDVDRKSTGLVFPSIRFEGKATPACSNKSLRLIRRRPLAS